MTKMKDPRKNLRDNQRGFVIIVALGMILLLSIFAVIIQQTTLNTLRSMKEGMNIFSARIFADSGLEYLKYFVSKIDGSGMNSGKIVCTYGDYSEATPNAGATDFGNPDLCEPFDKMVSLLNEDGKTNDIKIVAEIKGRANDATTANESFGSNCPGISSANCYVVPFPGTGSAGKNCEMYSPDFAAGAKGNINYTTGKAAALGASSSEITSQIDYACNWNKLTFGSSVTDRATIPLYYTADGGETVSPFSSDTAIGGGGAAHSFVVRVRTPCKPVTDGDGKTVTPVDCADSERYVLNEDDGDDIVVQWQITGQCKKSAGSAEYDEECGMIQFGTYEKEGVKIKPYFSAINEGRINYLNSQLSHVDDTAHKLLYPILYAIDTSSYSDVGIGPKASGLSKFLKLPTMKNPTLTLFLSGKLISKDGKNVPYLEYQVLTDTPVSDSKIKMEVSVTFNGNTYKKTIYKEEQKPLIDFAIQN